MWDLTNKKRIIRLLYMPPRVYDVIFNTQITSHFPLDHTFLHQVYSLVLSYAANRRICDILMCHYSSNENSTVASRVFLWFAKTQSLDEVS
jgi:hypothetical protein